MNFSVPRFCHHVDERATLTRYIPIPIFAIRYAWAGYLRPFSFYPAIPLSPVAPAAPSAPPGSPDCYAKRFLFFSPFFTSSLRKLSFRKKKISSTQNSRKHQEMWFLAGVRMYVCVCVRACVRFSMFQTPITHKRFEISIWNLIHQWSNHNPSIVTIFMAIDAGFVIL